MCFIYIIGLWKRKKKVCRNNSEGEVRLVHSNNKEVEIYFPLNCCSIFPNLILKVIIFLFLLLYMDFSVKFSFLPDEIHLVTFIFKYLAGI